MSNNQVILVDSHDNEIGVEEKLQAHKSGQLHRAFSIFVFNSQGQMLLQKRASSKVPKKTWSNSCSMSWSFSIWTL
ncbi:MAG: NUDIX domain-containing protein [Verrucomicrobia bacterium]|nr:NUDIX domain-containing protein [Verrucomicrobiota bacterium]